MLFGTGIEYAFTRAGCEDRVQLHRLRPQDFTFDAGGGATSVRACHEKVHLVKAGLNYKSTGRIVLLIASEVTLHSIERSGRAAGNARGSLVR